MNVNVSMQASKTEFATVPKKSLSWRCTPEMLIREGIIICPPAELFPITFSDKIEPFIATTRLGPKDAEWDVAGIFIPSSKPSEKFMLCLHGHGRCCTCLAWGKFFPALVEAGFNILAFDAPCFGRSSGKQTGQAHLWRSNDHELILRLFDCFSVQEDSVYSMAQCMGAAMLFRAMSAAPQYFNHRFIVNNATIGSWPANMNDILHSKSAAIMGWHELDADHMREAVGYKNLNRLEKKGLAQFFDNANERSKNNFHNVLDRTSIVAPKLSRASNGTISVFDPCPAVFDRIMLFLLSPPCPAKRDRQLWVPPTQTAVERGMSDSKINVCVRIRPLLEHYDNGIISKSIYRIDDTPEGSIISFRRDGKDVKFLFKHVFSPDCCRSDMMIPANALIHAVVRGEGHGTVFAYGQTGAGKTHTIRELLESAIPVLLSSAQLVCVEYWQIYNDRMYDLLAPNGSLAGGPSQHIVSSKDRLLELLDRGNKTRNTASTVMNASSSRSHAIMAFTLVDNGRKLTFVDLAGSERVKRSLSVGKTFKEATEINGSLLALSRVLRAKIDPSCKHIPYRDSSLTQALEDVLETPNHQAIMLACISPDENSLYESEQTLKFASCATYVKQVSESDDSDVGVRDEMRDNFEDSKLNKLHQAALATGKAFSSTGEYMVPAGADLPCIHCIGRDGSDTDSDTLLLLHYYGGICFEKGAEMWKDVIQKFPAGPRIIALSFSGHGMSSGAAPKSTPEANKFLESGGAIDQVQRVMSHFGVIKANIVGLDYGGGVGIQMALSFPHQVQSLVAWNPSYRVSSHQEATQQKWVKNMMLAVTPSVWMPEKKVAVLEQFMRNKAAKCRRDEDVWKKVIKMMKL